MALLNIKTQQGFHLIKKKNGKYTLFSGGFLNEKDCQINQNHFISEYYTLCVVINGKGRFIDEENQKTYLLSRGNFFQYFPQKKYSLEVLKHSNWGHFFITIPGDLHNLIKNMSGIDENKIVGQVKLTQDLIERLIDYCECLSNKEVEDSPYFIAEISSLIIDCLHNVNTFQPPPKPLADYGDFLKENCHRQNFKISDFASKNGYKYMDLAKNFKEYYGTTPSKFMISCRLEKAISLLKKDSLSIREISKILGYKNHTQFSTQFKKYYTKTPKQ